MERNLPGVARSHHDGVVGIGAYRHGRITGADCAGGVGKPVPPDFIRGLRTSFTTAHRTPPLTPLRLQTRTPCSSASCAILRPPERERMPEKARRDDPMYVRHTPELPKAQGKTSELAHAFLFIVR